MTLTLLPHILRLRFLNNVETFATSISKYLNLSTKDYQPITQYKQFFGKRCIHIDTPHTLCTPSSMSYHHCPQYNQDKSSEARCTQ